jgi:tetratricopeptide (TPR) repeat protein
MSSALEDRARALALAQNFGADALELNRRLVAANPADAGSHTRLARCYFEAGRLEEAETEYREVLRLDARNRIAAGGLETVAERRRQLQAPAGEQHAARRPKVPRVSGAVVPRARREPAEPEVVSAEPVPQSFTGLGADAFAELARCGRRAVHVRFAPRIIDLLRRVNALPSSVEIAGVREPGKRQLFRVGASDVHTDHAHWYAFNLGGRWEMQWNIGMYGGRPAGDWLRIGLGFNLTEGGADPARAAGIVEVRDAFRHFQEILDSPRGSLFLGWMAKEDGLIQVDEGGPRLDVREPSQAAKLISELDGERTEWLFFGKWLRPDDAAAAAVLDDPVSLVRTIDRAFTGLLPLFRAMRESPV